MILCPDAVAQHTAVMVEPVVMESVDSVDRNQIQWISGSMEAGPVHALIALPAMRGSKGPPGLALVAEFLRMMDSLFVFHRSIFRRHAVAGTLVWVQLGGSRRAALGNGAWVAFIDKHKARCQDNTQHPHGDKEGVPRSLG